MPLPALLRTVPLIGLVVAHGASATTLTGSFAAWRAGIAGTPYTATNDTGLSDPFALVLPTTTTVPLADGAVLRLSTPAQVTQPQDGFPYLLADGTSPDLLIPVDANGNQLRTETLSFGGLSALGFSLVPFSSNQNGPFSFTVRLGDGQSLAASLPGGSFNTGTTASAFFGFYGGGVTSLTITTTDPNGFAFGAFVDVPEPASLTLLAGSVALLGLRRRRSGTAAEPAAGHTA